jgi:hypothetical protein
VAAAVAKCRGSQLHPTQRRSGNNIPLTFLSQHSLSLMFLSQVSTLSLINSRARPGRGGRGTGRGSAGRQRRGGGQPAATGGAEADVVEQVVVQHARRNEADQVLRQRRPWFTTVVRGVPWCRSPFLSLYS